VLRAHRPDAPKHKGISALISDMKTPGIECRPFPELSEPDYYDFNEVFFTDVDVPGDNLVGELNQGWPITQGSLAHERAMLWIDYAYLVERTVPSMIGLGDREGPDGTPLRDDPRFRDEVAAFYIDAQALMLLGYRGFAKFMAGRASPEHSLLRLTAVRPSRSAWPPAPRPKDRTRSTSTSSDRKCGAKARGRRSGLRSFAGTILGGTSEIQRNIIAEGVLGLPR
jgi:alkylation response protein AidB-like acyl-CoA dehydrogenase